MPSRCRSTLICGEADRAVFEPLGYRWESAEPLSVDGEKIAGAILMVDEEAPGGHYDELTPLKDVPFVVSNGACPGDIEDHLLASDGREWVYVEALSESWYPAVRVSLGGKVWPSDLAEARSYWRLYDSYRPAERTQSQ